MLKHKFTSYVCAAAYLDRSFRSKILTNYFYEEFRALTPSPGVDVDEVIKNCIKAERVSFMQEIIFSLLTIFISVVYQFAGKRFASPIPGVDIQKSISESNTGDIIIAIIALGIFLFHGRRSDVFTMWHLLFTSIVQNLLMLSMLIGLMFLTCTAPSYFVHWCIIIVVVILVELTRAKITYDSIIKSMKTNEAATEIFESSSNKYREPIDNIEYSKKAQVGDFIVYSGTAPFAFAGSYLNEWSTSIPLRMHENIEDKSGVVNFTETDLYSYLSNTLKQINLGGLDWSLKRFINGEDFRYVANWDSNIRFQRPSVFSKQYNAKKLLCDNFCMDAMHIQFESQDNELVFSSLINLSLLSNKYLFIDVTHCKLPVLDEYYRRYIDSIRPNRSLYEIIGSITVSIAAAPVRLLISPYLLIFRLIRVIMRRLTRSESIRRIKHNDPSFDYGSPPNMRQLVGNNESRRFDQNIEIDMLQKTINNIIIDGLIDFLEEKNIDTRILRNDRDHIVNFGIMISGGTIKAQNIAIGKKALAISKILHSKKKRGP